MRPYGRERAASGNKGITFPFDHLAQALSRLLPSLDGSEALAPLGGSQSRRFGCSYRPVSYNLPVGSEGLESHCLDLTKTGSDYNPVPLLSTCGFSTAPLYLVY